MNSASLAREHSDPTWQRAIILLSGTVTAFVVVVALWWGRPVLVPIALAGLLTFLLNPVVRIVRRWGVPHVWSVLLAVSITGGILAVTGAMVMRQIVSVLAEIPQNTANIRSKVKSLRELSSGPLVESFVHLVDEVSQEFARPVGPKAPGPDTTTATPQAGLEMVRLQLPSTRWDGVPGYLGSFLDVLATLAFSLVLLVFFLLGRDDLRDRIVMLAGGSRLTLTSKALEDIAHRVGRYIAVVALLNGGFGILMMAGLLALQIPYALLWGFLSGTLRFIPYVGPWVGALFPILMSLSTFDGWWIPTLVLGYVLILELISNNIVEPLVLGQSTGVSPTALIVSAAFWLFLWGPVGLVLSAPFAVCLVVIGRNIPQLRFLQLLLGDAPALRAHVGLYQRLMLGDAAEAAAILLDRTKSSSMTEVCDELLIPALNCLRRDVRRGQLTALDQETVLDGLEGALLKNDVRRQASAASLENLPSNPIEPSPPPSFQALRIRILGYPALDDIDRVGLETLRQALDPELWEWESGSVDTLASELAARMATDPPDIVCIGVLPPGGLSRARYLCKRLRDAAPNLTIIVGRWGLSREIPMETERLEQAGAGFIATTMTDTIRVLESRRLLLIHRDAKAALPAPLRVAAAVQ
jgi:predicted PurR-regulated permease PerM